MTDPILQTRNLTVYYGSHRGIMDVSLSVEKGEVFGFLGPNGAGKTTTQRVLLDIIRPTKGSAFIFGLDCQKEGVTLRKRIGYLPGELSLYPNMKGKSFLEMIGSLQENTVSPVYRKELYDRLDFDPTRNMKEYSRGNKQKIGIIAAFMGKPELLILDEPTSGLDPLVQQTVMELVRETKADGRTVFFSSHILPEVQAVCDRVGIIREGALIKTERVETLTKQQFKRINLTLRTAPPLDAFSLEGVTETERTGNNIKLEIRQNLEQVMQIALSYGLEDFETRPVNLEEIFLAFYDRQNNGANHA